jgi:Domain of unknown function (DUF4375)
MKPKDYRAPLSAEDFDSIPADEEYPIDGYYETLIDANDKFLGIENEFRRGREDIRLIRQLTKGQQLLILLGVFDGQVANGGITQFFWNYPEYIFEVRDAIEHLRDAKVLRNYEKALEALVGKQDRWLELRKEWVESNEDPRWQTFQQTYGLLDLGWFDEAYFDEGGYNEKEEWVILKQGLRRPFLKKLAAYVKLHRAEFIEE